MIIPEPVVCCVPFHGDLISVVPGGLLGVQYTSDERPRLTACYVKAFIVLLVIPVASFLI